MQWPCNWRRTVAGCMPEVFVFIYCVVIQCKSKVYETVELLKFLSIGVQGNAVCVGGAELVGSYCDTWLK